MSSTMHRKRASLDDRQVREIFHYKTMFLVQPGVDPLRGKSKMVSELFRISPKSVRDIWNFRTWGHITLDTKIPFENILSFTSAQNFSTGASQPEGLDAPRLYPYSNDHKFSLLQSTPAKQTGRPLGSKDKCPRRKRKSSFGTKSLPESLARDSSPIEDFISPRATNRLSMLTDSFLDPPGILAMKEDEQLARTYPFFLSL